MAPLHVSLSVKVRRESKEAKGEWESIFFWLGMYGSSSFGCSPALMERRQTNHTMISWRKPGPWIQGLDLFYGASIWRCQRIPFPDLGWLRTRVTTMAQNLKDPWNVIRCSGSVSAKSHIGGFFSNGCRSSLGLVYFSVLRRLVGKVIGFRWRSICPGFECGNFHSIWSQTCLERSNWELDSDDLSPGNCKIIMQFSVSTRYMRSSWVQGFFRGLVWFMDEYS